MSPARQRAVAVTRVVTLLSLLVTGLLTVRSVRVRTREELADVGFGWPLVWWRQDQSLLDPPLPTHVRPLTPLEHPSQVLT